MNQQDGREWAARYEAAQPPNERKISPESQTELDRSAHLAQNRVGAAEPDEIFLYDPDQAPAGDDRADALEGGCQASATRVTPCVVGIGASAGGLEAIERFFDHVPRDPGLTFVVVQHLSPDFKSLMNELLARHTDIPIRQVEDGVQIEPNVIYLIPPKKNMVLSGGRLLLADQDQRGGLNLPIDLFFRSLAQDCGDRSVAVILSGTGSDGSRGIRDVHEAGGLVLVQDQQTAGFDGMPRAAIATGMADVVLPPERMAEKILQYTKGPQSACESPISVAEEVPDELSVIFALLRREFGIDFTCYKPATMHRRIERRMTLGGVTSLGEYRRRLADSDQELKTLCKDLLVEVTQFFRDPEAFELLKQDIVPAICQQAGDEGIRVWVAGCATGEEAYSLAMLFHEQIDKLKRAVDIKIFATDVHRPSLDVASNGRYSSAAVRDLPAEYLERYFVPRDEDYIVSQSLRQMVIFAPHNLTKDPPFTKLDLIVCRNVLIYFKPAVQRKVLTLFHFGLRTGGVVFLGPSESLAELSDEFEVLDARWKQFRKRREVRLGGTLKNPPPFAMLDMNPGLPRREPSQQRVPDPKQRFFEQLLSRLVPQGFVLDQRRELVHVFGDVGRFLKVPPGGVTRDIMKMVDDGLRIALASALHRLERDEMTVVYNAVSTASHGQSVQLRLTVDRVQQSDRAEALFLVRLEDEQTLEREPLSVLDGEKFELDGRTSEHIRSLEGELVHAKEHLQSTVEELETSNEELQSTNEELVASNEELQSTNEELHSVNEELYTVNAEFQRKIEELTRLTNDMDNLLRSTDIGTVFLDRDLKIRKFTPAVSRIFNLLPHDVGRPLQHISSNLQLDNNDLIQRIGSILQNGEAVEMNVEGTRGDAFLMRGLPYRSEHQEIEGVVLTFTDVSALRRSQDRLVTAQRRMQIALDAADIGIWDWDLTTDLILWGTHLHRALGFAADRFASDEPDVFEARGDVFWQCIHPEDRDRVRSTIDQCIRDQTLLDVDFRVLVDSNEERFIATRADVTRRVRGRATRLTGACLDITARKRAEQEIQEAVKRRDHFLAVLSHELRNPLGAIANACQVMQAGELSVNNQEEACRVIARQSDHMTRLLDDLLDVARINENKLNLQYQAVDLSDVMRETLRTVAQLADRAGLNLRASIPEAPVWISGDVVRIQQVQVNLLQNAIKYTPRGGQIDYSLTADERWAEICVRDNGVGMTAELQQHVFERFVQSDQTLDRSAGGLGLGLTLVQTLVNLHGGQVSVFSEGLGRGSQFTVRLPIGSPPEGEPNAETNQREPSQTADLTTTRLPGSRPSRGQRLVLVEDNADNRKMMESLLRFDGYEVIPAADGPSGLATILEHKPHIAVVDIGLPGMDGFELARQIRQRWNGDGPIRLIALTGYGRPEDHEAVMRAGFDHHLVKPVRFNSLTEILQRYAGAEPM